MRVLFVCPLLLAPIAAAQPPTGAAIVAKLVSDLLPLKLAVSSDDPLKDDVYTRNELQSVETYSQSGIWRNSVLNSIRRSENQ